MGPTVPWYASPPSKVHPAVDPGPWVDQHELRYLPDGDQPQHRAKETREVLRADVHVQLCLLHPHPTGHLQHSLRYRDPILQDLRELWPWFHVRHCQRSLDVEHLDRNAERVLLCHSQAEEDCYLLRPRGLRLRPESAECYHVIVFQLPDRQKPSQRMFLHSTMHQMQDTQPFLHLYIILLNIYM